MIKQLNQSTIETGNSMYLFFFTKKRNFFHAWLFKIRILDVYFYIHDQKTSWKIKVFPFYFYDTFEIIEINTLINKLTRVKLTKYLPKILT